MLDPKTNYYRYRIFYSKTGSSRFIGHLDLQSFFNKAFKRANLPVAYSQGFNPHQLLSIALPLSMGMSGKNEIAEIYLTLEIDTKILVEKLNKQMPQGMEILNAELVPSVGKSAAGLVNAAKYLIRFPSTKFDENIIKSLETTDFADKIIKIQIQDDIIAATLYAGSAKNLKPQVLAQYIIDSLNLDIEPKDIGYERTQILI
ncbi:MAG: TIGR03936 family radical SAM-associated protein [Defluviitaleaceae bacterium]|nr:TIGR03936 family radical SAM-associated protein [Defluviitaleaceae bacterium]